MESIGGGVASIQARIASIRTRFGPGEPLGGGSGGGQTRGLSPDVLTRMQNGELLRAAGGSVTATGLGSEFDARLRGILDSAGPQTHSAPFTPSPGTGPSGVDHAEFARDVLTRLEMPVTDENVRAIDAWARAEGTRAAFNPLATTQGWSGATKFNSVGVRNYVDYDDGVAATVRTLTNGHYGAILDALRAGNDAFAVGRAVAASPWGTGEGVLRVLNAQS